MLTLEQVELYERYNGNGDSFSRFAKKEEDMIISDENWRILDDFVQDIIFIRKEITSESYIKNVIKRLKENCDNDITFQKIWDINIRLPF